MKMKKEINSLYIHIPFCRKLCPYCDFSKVIKNNSFEKRYIDQLIKDLSSVEDKFFLFKTIYIGGGTPSCLDYENLIKLLEKISMLKGADCEFTIEANPEDIDENFLKLIKKYGVNRISIGVQSFNKNILSSITRKTEINFIELIEMIKKYIDNINLDIIYGLPGSNISTLQNDLNFINRLDIQHASFYSLSINKGTEFYNKGIKEVDDSVSRGYYDLILKNMRDSGFVRYEVSNFCKPGYESLHNLNYWKNKEYVAIGLNSSGYVWPYRYKNSNNLTQYINGENRIEKELITNGLLKEYYLITNLRLYDGFSLKEYKKIFNEDFLIVNSKNIDEMKKNHLINIDYDRFYCTDEGLILLDRVLLKLL